MGMGWKKCYDEPIEDSRRKCKCGLGEVIRYVEYEEESDYPPFNRGESYSYSTTCPKDCENIKKR